MPLVAIYFEVEGWREGPTTTNKSPSLTGSAMKLVPSGKEKSYFQHEPIHHGTQPKYVGKMSIKKLKWRSSIQNESKLTLKKVLSEFRKRKNGKTRRRKDTVITVIFRSRNETDPT